jgi:hypothetical protein
MFSNSFYHILRIPLINFFKFDRGYSYYPMEEHNKYLFNNLSDTLLSVKNNTFLYAHFYMPHSPLLYRPQIELLSNNFNNYLIFWDFTNLKIKELISKLTINDSYKIIITGDHGFKGDNRINPKLTFSAFYGFNEDEVKLINSVQDISYVITVCN